MPLTDSEYRNLRLHLQDLRELMQGVERQVQDIAALDRADALLVLGVAGSLRAFDERLEELEVTLGV